MTAAQGALPPAQSAKPLPELRQDLRLIEGPSDLNGARRWLIHDPLQHRYFSIGQKAHILFQLWYSGATVESVLDEAWERYSETIDATDVARFTSFLHSSGLTLESPGGGWRGFHAIAQKRQSSLGRRLLHNYLFFRIPLFHPERFLAATLHLMRPFGTRAFAIVVSLFGAFGLYLVSREWDAFASTIASAFSLEGAALLAVAMMIVKLIHELGHAYVATHFGCRVPVIGVAFILGFPMLYCDVTDTWRLQSRRKRMFVDAAGIAVDLAVACVATLLWAFLPPGAMKSLAFSLATVGWVFSLVMNLNPFMRFDGYHIAVDVLGVDNMQERAMALARWRFREILFGLRLPPPERLSRRSATLMVLYGWATWIYRLILFTGIAVAVYAYFFKLVGIMLFLVEIGYFIAAPLWRELREWIAMRKAILSSWRTAVTGTVALILLGAMVVPWSSTVEVPAVLEAGGLSQIYPVAPAQVREVRVAPGRAVAHGDVLVRLAAPALTQELSLTELKLELVQLRQSRRASDGADRGEAVVLDQEHIALMERRAGLRQQLRELDVRAPFSGEVVEIAPALHVARWINLKDPMVVMRAHTAPLVRGYLEAADIWRVREGAMARFVPNDLALPSLQAKVLSIAWASSTVLEQVELVANFGGRIPARIDQRRQPVPIAAQYSLRAAVSGEISPGYLHKTVSGVLVVEGQPESYLSRAWRQTLKVLIRESGV